MFFRLMCKQYNFGIHNYLGPKVNKIRAVIRHTYKTWFLFTICQLLSLVIDYTILSLLVASSCQSQPILRIGKKNCPFCCILLTALAYLFSPKPKILPADLARAQLTCMNCWYVVGIVIVYKMQFQFTFWILHWTGTCKITYFLAHNQYPVRDPEGTPFSK